LSESIAKPSQYAEKLPATKPLRIFRDAPPSRELMTIARVWRELVEVKTLTSSGISAPASVPQLITMASFHHRVSSPPSAGIIIELMMKVSTMDRIEVSQTSDVSGASKLNLSAFP